MKPSQVSTVLEALLAARENVLLVGAPGVGKSDIVAQSCARLGYDVAISHPVVSDPTDYKGLPAIVGGKAEWLPYGELERLILADAPLVCFLDDLGQAPPAVQAAAMQLLLARQINGKAISENVRFVAATNRKQDRAGVSGMLEPVKSRFSTILEVETDTNDWCKWAVGAGMPIELIAFVRFRPNLLLDFKPSADMVNSPCPRTIAAAGRLLKLGLPEETLLDVLTGTVGRGCAAELIAFRQVFKSLPSLDAIILAPDTSDIPEREPAVMYAIACGLAYKATDTNLASILRYAGRFGRQEYAVVLVKSALDKSPALKSSAAFTLWAATHSDLFV